jgi:4-amino-4-deoxy-L-arabinose transferase-like glycosyltransferase
MGLWLRIARDRRARTALIVVLAIVGFVVPTVGRDIVTSHEARVYQTARQMAHAGRPWDAHLVAVPLVRFEQKDSGGSRVVEDDSDPPISVNPWLIPVLNRQIRIQKPPLPYWTVAACFRVLGENAFIARLPSVVMGVLLTWVVYDLGRLLYGRRTAVVAALVWVSTNFVLAEYAKVMADPYLAFSSVGCIWAWIRATRAATIRGGAMWTMAAYLAFAAALLAKGPVVAVHVGVAIGAYHACFRARPFRGAVVHLLGLSTVLAIALPWPVQVLRTLPDAMALWRSESVDRLSDNTDHGRPWWFYVPALVQLSFPWTPMWMAGIAMVVVRQRSSGARARAARRRWFPVAWLGVTAAVFSLVNSKKDAYLLPAAPAQALLIAQGVVSIVAHARRYRSGKSMTNVALGAQAIVPVLVAVAVIAAGVTAVPRIDVLVGAIVTVAFAVIPWTILGRGRFSEWTKAQAAALAVAMAALCACYTTPSSNHRSPRELGAAVTRWLASTGGACAVDRLPEELSIYMPLLGPPAVDARRELRVVSEGRPLRATTSGLGRPDLAKAQRLALPEAERLGRWDLYVVPLLDPPPAPATQATP